MGTTNLCTGRCQWWNDTTSKTYKSASDRRIKSGLSVSPPGASSTSPDTSLSKYNTFRILDLPPELQYCILDQCTAFSLLQLSHTNRYFYDTINNPTGKSIWKRFKDIHSEPASKSLSLRVPIIKHLFFNTTMARSLFSPCASVKTVAPVRLFKKLLGEVISIEVELFKWGTSVRRVASFIAVVVETSRWNNEVTLFLVSDLDNLKSGYCFNEEPGRTPVYADAHVKLEPLRTRLGPCQWLNFNQIWADEFAQWKIHVDQSKQAVAGGSVAPPYGNLWGKSVLLWPLRVSCGPKQYDHTALSSDELLFKFESVVSKCNATITNLNQRIMDLSWEYTERKSNEYWSEVMRKRHASELV